MIQHHLGNHVPQTEALFAFGLAPRDLDWIDIPYTSTRVVREALWLLPAPAGHGSEG